MSPQLSLPTMQTKSREPRIKGPGNRAPAPGCRVDGAGGQGG